LIEIQFPEEVFLVITRLSDEDKFLYQYYIDKLPPVNENLKRSKFYGAIFMIERAFKDKLNIGGAKEFILKTEIHFSTKYFNRSKKETYSLRDDIIEWCEQVISEEEDELDLDIRRGEYKIYEDKLKQINSKISNNSREYQTMFMPSSRLQILLSLVRKRIF
jgi:hypothetical protein